MQWVSPVPTINVLLYVHHQGLLFSSSNGARLQGTGTVWESCDATAKLPKGVSYNVRSTMQVTCTEFALSWCHGCCAIPMECKTMQV